MFKLSKRIIGAALCAMLAAGVFISCKNDSSSSDDTPTLSSIAVKTNPTKTAYTVGDAADYTGLAITLTYSDGSTTEVTYSSTGSSFNFAGFDSSAAAESQTITVSYGGKTATFTIKISAAASQKTLSAITVDASTTASNKYKVGETLDPTGLVLKLTYSDSTTATVTYSTSNASEFTFSNVDTSTAGEKTLTITYGGKSVDVTITVTAANATSVTVTLPTTVTDSYSAFTADKTSAASGETITFTATKTDADAYSWVLDKATVSTTSSFAYDTTSSLAGSAQLTLYVKVGSNWYNKTATIAVE